MLGSYKMSLIGSKHEASENGVCQDSCDVAILDNGWIVAAIADGLGSARRSELGSSTAVNTVISFVNDNYPGEWHEESLIALLRVAFCKALSAIKMLSEVNNDDLCYYDTTLTAAIYNGTNVVYGHVGDGGIVALSSFGEFSVLTETQKGEAFNETMPLRAGPDNWIFGTAKDNVCSLIMMTDGIFNIALPWILAQTDQPININFVRPFMDINVLKVSTKDDFETAQTEIEDFFKTSYKAQITDDKTIVGIINTDVVPEIMPSEYYVEPDWDLLDKNHHDKLYKHNLPEKTGNADDEVNKKESTIAVVTLDKRKTAIQKHHALMDLFFDKMFLLHHIYLCFDKKYTFLML